MLRHVLVSVALFASLGGASPARAVDFFWIGPGLGGPGGNFQQSLNWTFTPPPFPLVPAPGGADDTANFDLGIDPEDRYTVTGVSGENDRLLVHNDSLRLEINDYQLLSEDEDHPSLVVGVTSGDIGEVILSGVGAASLLTNDTVIGLGVASIGDVTVDHLQWAVDGSLNVGGVAQFVGDTGGDGVMTIQNGSLVASDSGRIGGALGSIGEVIVNGSSWTVSENLGVGGQGIGTLSIENGGVVSSSGGSVLGDSIASVNGVGSAWTMSTDLRIFQGANSTLNIQNGGTVTVGAGGSGGILANSTAEITLDSDSVLDVRGTIVMNTGAFNFLGGTLHVEEFDDHLVNQGGTLAPGNPDQLAGSTNITGNYTHQSAATLEIEIGGTTAGTQHDFVNVEGTALLAGELELALIAAYVPGPDDEFVVFNTDSLLLGSFSNVGDGQRLTTTGGLGSFLVHYGPTSAFNANQVVLTEFLPMTPGDFDGDGDVDGADFVIWQTNFPTAGGATLADGDADGDGDVDGADFVVWQTNFPFTPGPGTSPVPEPAAWMLAIVALGGVSVSLRRCRVR